MVRTSSDDAENALRLQWTFGFNNRLVSGVHNLSDGTRFALFYVSAHSGVIYDAAERTQVLLQGHKNPITAACVSADRRFIATGDTGPDSLIVVWDSKLGTPLKTYFNPHPYGVASLDMSADGRFLASLSAKKPAPTDNGSLTSKDGGEGVLATSASGGGDSGEDEHPQTLAIWAWTTETDDQDEFDEYGEAVDSSDNNNNNNRGGNNHNNNNNGSKGEVENENEGPLLVREIPAVSSKTPSGGTSSSVDLQHCVRFSPWDNHELVSNGTKSCFFWTWFGDGETGGGGGRGEGASSVGGGGSSVGGGGNINDTKSLGLEAYAPSVGLEAPVLCCTTFLIPACLPACLPVLLMRTATMTMTICQPRTQCPRP